MKVAGMEEDLPIWDYLETKIAPFSVGYRTPAIGTLYPKISLGH